MYHILIRLLRFMRLTDRVDLYRNRSNAVHPERSVRLVTPSSSATSLTPAPSRTLETARLFSFQSYRFTGFSIGAIGIGEHADLFSSQPYRFTGFSRLFVLGFRFGFLTWLNSTWATGSRASSASSHTVWSRCRPLSPRPSAQGAADSHSKSPLQIARKSVLTLSETYPKKN